MQLTSPGAAVIIITERFRKEDDGLNHEEKRVCLIKRLLAEQPRYKRIAVPDEEQAQKDLLRSLMNVRLPAPIDSDFLSVQDAYLKEAIADKGITSLADLQPIENGIYLWQGDITTLACDAIVNAANSGLTGCYQPLHRCIDNCIHTYAGIQLRNTCAEIIRRQGSEEPAGRAKITPAFNLPCRYVLHTVGPIVGGRLTENDCELLKSCYRSCLKLARDNHVGSIAFCCISTGVFGFPAQKAAQIAVETVREYQARNVGMKVIFNVFKDEDLRIYRNLLG